MFLYYIVRFVWGSAIPPFRGRNTPTLLRYCPGQYAQLSPYRRRRYGLPFGRLACSRACASHSMSGANCVSPSHALGLLFRFVRSMSSSFLSTKATRALRELIFRRGANIMRSGGAYLADFLSFLRGTAPSCFRESEMA